ncbi:ABC transporter ATP-binding protein [Thiohalomonas denitrificans]|uniref:Iron(III) transport system ATP-binding protein n=1 Tax=Thiohalomonas denitrificans TaxID=415747 RepID=A0A1G5R3C7_9GAMM|nr:ABC transporter ATP-binding protein [Thiohalomonas denitrificans]SCZ68348.1 iron(III) transport system ATP-binding protein [Thiohalomonas denitrificans]
MQLEVDNVTLGYGNEDVVHSVSFRLKPGELGCLLGPSGCGKTTLLRAVAGFEPVRAGAIRIGGETVSSPQSTLPPERRGVGMVFQDYALFPHLSVRDNIAFGLRRSARSERAKRVSRLLDLIGLAGYGDAYPHQLSGGQQQRVALARALAPKPRLLLLDEPFSGLDVERREELAREVRCILKEEGITALMVTHDQSEAFATADSIGVMSGGEIVQWDTGYNLYHRPASRFVADFIGQGELIPGRVNESGGVETELGVIGGAAPAQCRPGCAVEVLIRPDDVLDCPTGTPARVDARAFRGADFLYQLSLPSGARILCLTHSHNRYEVGEHISVRPQIDHVVAFPVEPRKPEALTR